MLIELTRWLEHSALGQGIHNSSWLFPFIEVFHLIAIGTRRRRPACGFAPLWVGPAPSFGALSFRAMLFVLNIGLAVLILSGFLLYVSEGAKMY